ncbi:MAG: twin-arginine translocase TatA/TatE family subunit [Armatimonas sp.]
MGVTFAFLSPTTIIIVVIVALLVFGPHKMPELMRQLGQALREFKKMTGDVQNVFSLDDHLSYDRYDPPSYSYTHPTTHYEPLDQYQPEPEDEVKALPALESDMVDKATDVTATETAEATGEAALEKPKRKRAPRTTTPRKKKVETQVTEASAPEETIHTTSSEQTEDKE